MILLCNKRSFMFALLMTCFLFSHALCAQDKPLHMPGSVIEYEKENESGVFQVLLSSPKRISNSLVIEAQQRVSGVKKSSLLQLGPGVTSQDAFSYYASYINDFGKVAYQCEKRACGSSNYWANNIFKEHRLYGRDSGQFYLAGRIQVGSEPVWLTVYSVTNGLKQNLVYLSVVSDESELCLHAWPS